MPLAGTTLARETTLAQRHAGGFAVLQVLPVLEYYLSMLHVYVVLQLALFGGLS